MFPSSFTLLTATDGTVGLAVRCPSCRRLSLNLVSHPHVDVPFHNDREIGVVEHMFAEDALATLDEFRARAVVGLVRRAQACSRVIGVPRTRGATRPFHLHRATERGEKNAQVRPV